MKENQEKIRFKDNFSIVPVDLCRDEEIPGEAIAVYAVMASFGPTAAASLKAYADRLGWAIPRVRKYQRVLEKANWITLEREGMAALDGGSPRIWWLNSFRGQKLWDRDFKTLENQKAKADNSILSNESSKPSKKHQKHPQQDLFWLKAKEIWKKNHTTELAWPRLAGFPKKLGEALTDFGAEELARRWENLVADPYSRPSLMALVCEPDKWITRREKNGGNNGRFNTPGTDWKPSGQ